jgi:hypothetical protein
MARGKYPPGRPDGEPPLRYIVWAVVLLGGLVAGFVAYLNATGQG